MNSPTVHKLSAALFSVFLISCPLAASAETGDAERLASEGLGKILQALDLLMKTIPQYAAPEVQPNGDIIIRRLHPDDEKTPESDDESSDGTET